MCEAIAWRSPEASFFYFVLVFAIVGLMLACFCLWVAHAGSELVFVRGAAAHRRARWHVASLVAIHLVFSVAALAILTMPSAAVIAYWEVRNGVVHFCEGLKFLCCIQMFQHILLLQEQSLGQPLL